MLFQSTPPCGGERRRLCYVRPRIQFQSTPPCGGELPGHLDGVAKALSFNPHPRAGVNVKHGSGAKRYEGFNPHPRAGVNNWAQVTFLGASGFQSTPPCGGEQHPKHDFMIANIVSIHTPVRG